MVMNLEALMQALASAQAGYDQSAATLRPIEARMADASSQRFGRGLLGLGEAIFDAYRRKKTEPQYNEALTDALNKSRGVYDAMARLEEFKLEQAERMKEGEKAAEEARMSGLYQGAGVDPGRAALFAAGGKLPAGAKPPIGAQYAEAVGLTPGSREYQEFVRSYATKPGTQVNVGDQGPQIGTIPPGHELIKDPQSGRYRMEPIPGGPADVERQEAEKKASGRQREAGATGDIVLREIDRSFDLIGKAFQGEDPVSRYWRAGRAKIKGTPENIMNEDVLPPIKANIGFDRLQLMRENSPTGGALGNVSNFEVDTLQATAGKFDADMPFTMLEENLTGLRTKYLDAIHGTAEARAKLVQQGVVSPEVNAQIEALYGKSGDSGAESEYEKWKRERGLN